MDVFSLFAKIGLDTSEYEDGISKAGEGVESLKSDMGSVSGANKTLINALNKVAQVSGVVEDKVYGLASQLDSATDEVKQMDDAFTNSIQITSDTSDETQKLTKELSKTEKGASALGETVNTLSRQQEKGVKSTEKLADSQEKLAKKSKEFGNETESMSGKFSTFPDVLNRAATSSKSVATAVNELKTPFDKLMYALDSLSEPSASLQERFAALRDKADAIIHPIETLKQKFTESGQAAETQRNMMTVLAESYEAAKQKVDNLTQAFNKAMKEGGSSTDKTKELAEELKDAEKNADDAKKELEDFAKTVKNTGEESEKSSGKLEKLANGLKNGLVTAAKVGGVALAGAAAGIAALSKSSLDQYADYEQLKGGVETLFQDSSWKVMDNASKAFYKAGMSANEYMETVTSFAASLIDSTAGSVDMAADLADMAITDMSDNANKMGTDMESLQNAYAGFAKGNYTMLDNLKLGYGGTEEEMQRLIDKANAMNEQQGNSTNYQISNYADIVRAIHDVQTAMDITGTTSKEASTTIEGSVNSMKSAWENLVTGLGDDSANLDVLIDNFVRSVEVASDNIVPRLLTIIGRISEMVEKLAPVLAEKIPSLIETLLPPLIQAAVSLVQALVAALPQIMQALIDAMPTIIDTIVAVLPKLVEQILSMLPMLVDAGVQIIVALAEGIAQMLPELVPAIVDVVLEIVDVLTDPENLGMLLEAAIQIISALAEGLMKALPLLLAKAPEIIANLIADLIGAIPELLKGVAEVGIAIVEGIWEGIKSAGSSLIENVKGFFGDIVDGVKDFLGIHSPSRVFAGIGENMALGLGEGWDNEFSRIKGQIEGGMDFGNTSVGIDAQYHSAMSDSPAFPGIQNSPEQGKDITIPITLELDGAVLARKMVHYNQRAQNLVGPSLVMR